MKEIRTQFVIKYLYRFAFPIFIIAQILIIMYILNLLPFEPIESKCLVEGDKLIGVETKFNYTFYDLTDYNNYTTIPCNVTFYINKCVIQSETIINNIGSCRSPPMESFIFIVGPLEIFIIIYAIIYYIAKYRSKKLVEMVGV